MPDLNLNAHTDISPKYRLRFSKTGQAVYMSHLDLMRTMQRAFARAGFSLKHSEGFNPHPQISIALPLSVGMSSVCELLDFSLQVQTSFRKIPPYLNKVLPQGIEVTDIYPAGKKVRDLKWLSVIGELFYNNSILSPSETAGKLEQYFSADEIVIRKKTKRGLRDTNIAPGIKSAEFAVFEDKLVLMATISAAEPTVSPEHMMQALKENAPELAPDFAAFTRTETYDNSLGVFR